MTWGLTKEHSYWTNIESEDIGSCLRTIVDTRIKFDFLNNKIKKPYYGFVRQTTFEFYDTPRPLSYSSVKVTGVINRTDTDENRKVNIKITPVRTLGPTVGIVISSLLPIAGLISMDLQLLVTAIIPTLIFIMMIYLPFQANYKGTLDKVEKLLRLRDFE